MKKIILIFIFLFVYSPTVQAELRLRPSQWAVPVIGSDLENMYALDSKVYRSEQPDREAFAQLEKFGIKAILNLRQYHTDTDEAEDTTLALQHVKMNAGKIKTEQLLQALKIIKESKGPILIHCWHGSDRTGAVAASYRIVFQNWSKQDAIEELKEGGYGYHAKIYPNVVETIQALDVNALKLKLGLLPHPEKNN